MKKPRPDEEQTPAAVRKAAMDCLARREYGERELAEKLLGRGYREDLVDSAIEGLKADNLLSDSRFAEAFIHSRYQRGSGPQKIRAELRGRGIDGQLIDACLDAGEYQWERRVAEVRERKYGSDLPGDFRERSRQMRFLQQRGFTAEQIARAFRDE